MSWSSTIGNFITNFGMLDLHTQDFLETLLSPEEFLKMKERPFFDRVECIKQRLGETDCVVTKKTEFEDFFNRLDHLRETRNHIAHGILRIGPAADQKTFIQTLSLPRELDGTAARHLQFSELLAELKKLNGLIEEFESLAQFKAVVCANQ
jgi:hypothetical protein